MGSLAKIVSLTIAFSALVMSHAVAFEAAQKWRRQDGQMAFHKGSYFVVVESMGSDTVELNGIVTAVEATFDSRR